MKKILSLLPLLLALLCLPGCGSDAAPEETAAPVATADPDLPAAGAETETAFPQAEPKTGGFATGTYVYTDGSYITVEEDGTVWYVPYAYGTVAGVPVNGQVFFRGAVNEWGVVTLQTAFYRGVDVTRRGGLYGSELESMWTEYAQSMYVGLSYYGSVDLYSAQYNG